MPYRDALHGDESRGPLVAMYSAGKALRIWRPGGRGYAQAVRRRGLGLVRALWTGAECLEAAGVGVAAAAVVTDASGSPGGVF